MAEGKITGKEVIADDVFERVERFVKSLDEIVIGFDDVEKKAKSAINSFSMGKAMEKDVEATKKAQSAISEYERIQKRLVKEEEKRVVAQTRLSKRLSEQRVETQRLNRETKRNSIINNENERAYKRLSALYNRQKSDLKDLIILYGENSEVVQRFSREVEKTGDRIKKADNIAGDFQRNVGNYPTVFRPAIATIRQFIGAFGLVEGIRFGVRLVADLNRVAREAKGIQFAFENIGNDASDAFDKIKASTRGLLSDLQIKQAVVEFDNFNLKVDELATVLEFVAVRSAQTGKSFEYLRDSAIEAITKESVLRADNLGLSQKELNEEISNGATFMEAFGKIARREIGDAGDILEEAGDGSQRFNASLENVKVTLGEITSQLKFFSAASSLLDGFNNSLKVSEVSGSELNLTVREIRDGILENESAISRLGAILLGSLSPAGRRVNKLILEEIERRKQLTKDIEAQAKAYKKLYGVESGPLGEGQEQAFDFLVGPNQSRTIRTLKDINDEIERYNDILKETDLSDKNKIKSTLEKIDSLERERDAVLNITETRSEAKKVLDGSVASYKKIIQELTDERDRLADSRQEYEEYNLQIELAQRNIDKLTQGLIILSNTPNLESSIFGASEIDLEKQEELAQGFADRQKSNTDNLLLERKRQQQIEEAFNTRSLENARDLSDKQLDSLREAFQLEIELRKQFERAKIDLAYETVDAITQARIDSVDREIEENRRALDLILEDENASEQSKIIARKKYEQQQEELEKKRRKREREGLIFQQALALAEIAINLSKTLAAINAAAFAIDAITPFAFGGAGAAYRATNIPLAIGTAAAESASVLARLIPAFFKGKNYTDKYEGPATWGERGREVKIGADGKVEISPNRTTPLFVKKDDIITPSISAFNDKLSQPNSEVFKRVVGNKYYNDTESRMKVVYVNNNTSVLDEKIIEMAIINGMRKAKVNLNQKIEIKQSKNRRYFSA